MSCSLRVMGWFAAIMIALVLSSSVVRAQTVQEDAHAAAVARLSRPFALSVPT